MLLYWYALLSLIVLIIHFFVIKSVRIHIRKSYLDLVIWLACIGFFIAVMSSCPTTGTKLNASLLLVLLAILRLRCGITAKGFRSLNQHKHFIPWHKIKKIVMQRSDSDIFIQVKDNFMTQNFHFHPQQYEAILKILKENLPEKTQLEIERI